MKASRIPLSARVLLLLLLPPSTHATATLHTLSATAERVSDGDTVVAATANRTTLRIRLLGITR